MVDEAAEILPANYSSSKVASLIDADCGWHPGPNRPRVESRDDAGVSGPDVPVVRTKTSGECQVRGD